MIEQTVIYQILSNNDYATARKVRGADLFAEDNCRTVIGHIQDLMSKKEPLTWETVSAEINAAKYRKDLKENILDYLVSISKSVYLYDNDTLPAIERQFVERSIKDYGTKTLSIGEKYPVEAALDDLHTLLSGLKRYKGIEEPINYELYKTKLLKALEEKAPPPAIGLRIGHDKLRDFFGDLLLGHVYTILGRPSMCKTMVADNLAVDLSKRYHGVYYTFENSATVCCNNLVACDSQVYASSINQHNLNAYQMNLVGKTIKSVNRLWIVDKGMTADGIGAHIESLNAVFEEPIRYVIIDYFQIIRKTHRLQPLTELEYIADSIQELAKEMNVAVIILTQSNKRDEGRDDGQVVTTSLGDCKGTGNIEQISEQVVGLEGVRKDPRRTLRHLKNKSRELRQVEFEFDFAMHKMKDYPEADRPMK